MRGSFLDIRKDRIWRRPLFWVCSSLFLVHQILQKILNFRISWADNYLDMLVLMPILLTLYSLEKKYFRLKGQSGVSKLEMVLLTLVVGVIAEGLFPYLSQEFTYDIKDFLFLCLGTIAFAVEQLIYNKKLIE